MSHMIHLCCKHIIILPKQHVIQKGRTYNNSNVTLIRGDSLETQVWINTVLLYEIMIFQRDT